MSDLADAIQELREGGKAARKGWRGKWLELDNDIIMLVRENGERHSYLDVTDELVEADLRADDWEGID